MSKDSLSKRTRVCEHVWILWMLVGVVVLGGCSGGSVPVAVTLSPGTTQALDQGQTVNVNATVAHDSTAEGVTWALASGPGALSNPTKTSVTYSANGATGTAVVTATSVKDKSKTAKVTVTVTAMPSISTTTLAAGTEGTAYSATVEDSGGAGTCTFSVSAGALPAGLTMSNSGAISGTPTGPSGTANFTVKVTDQSTAGAQSATQALAITINLPAPPSITTTTLPGGTEGTAYNQTVAATGGLGTLTLSISAGNLPPGLAMNSSGVISGTPTGPNGTSNFTMQVQDQSSPAQTATKALSIAINLPAAPTIGPASLTNGNVGSPYSQTLTVTNGLAPYTWSVSAGTLPAGLTLAGSGATATISGTPTTQQSGVAFTVQVTDSSNPSQKGTQAYTVTIGAALPLAVTTTSLPAGVVLTAYAATNLTATGGYAPYSWLLVSPGTGPLPPGLALSAAGVITGTPTTAGTYPFTVQVTDSKSATATANLSITVNAISTGCPTGNEKAMKGQYAFSLKGYTPDGFLGAVGSFTADGSGNITAGYVDAYGQQIQGNGLGVQGAAVTATGSTYTMGTDNRGCATIVTPFYTFATRFAIPPSASGRAEGTIQEFESAPENFIGSGQLFEQKVPTAVPTGNWVHEQIGIDSIGAARMSIVGVDVYGSSGNITGGEYDYGNYAGGPTEMTGLTGTYTTPDATTGRFTLTTKVGSLSANRAAYLISGTQAIEITKGGHILVGYLQLQSGSLTFAGNLASFGAGAGVAQFSTISVSGSSYTAKIYEDDNGVWATTNPATATCAFTIDTYGRVSTSGATCGTSYTNGAWTKAPVYYLTGANTGFMMGAGRIYGQIAAQTSTAIPAGNYYFGTFEAEVFTAQGGFDSATGVVTLTSGGTVMGTEDRPREPNQPINETMAVNSDGTFSLSGDPGVIIGLIVSPTEVVKVEAEGKIWTSILVFNAVH